MSALQTGLNAFLIQMELNPDRTGNGIAAAAFAGHPADDPSETTIRLSNICMGTQGDEETWVKFSNDHKLALHIGCTPNAKEYPRCCLPVISSLRTALVGTCARMYTITYEKATLPSTRVELVSTHIWMWVGFNLLTLLKQEISVCEFLV